MTELVFVVNGKPQPKQRARSTKSGHYYTPKETVAFERKVALIAKEIMAKAGLEKTDKPVTIDVWAYFSDHRRRDADNVLKCVQDGCNDIVYYDDNQITDCSSHKRYDKLDPRTAVTVTWED